MKSGMSFQERARLGAALLSKQQPVTIEEKRAQFQWLKENSVQKTRSAELKTINKKHIKE